MYEQIKDQYEPDDNDGEAEKARRAKGGDTVTCPRCDLPVTDRRNDAGDDRRNGASLK
ncbi:hypothetical protein [Caballeronia telluris]|uniref:hypothetical protein n=1 Tax=Caballeronia telluris TaxID=326475 RepID=UPI000ADF70A8|nr:hypothetical protein [Caballeronia telluris]